MKAAYEGQGAAVYRGIHDGQAIYIYSQSMLKQIDICPERGRRTLLDLMPRYNTDSTAIGHGVHEAIELCVHDLIAGNGGYRPEDMWEIATLIFDEEMYEPDARWQKYSVGQAHEAIWNCLNAWHTNVLPTLNPWLVERKLGPYLIHEDVEQHYSIFLQGQADYIDHDTGLADWKTSSRPWIPWEHKRWDIQPTVYTWLSAHASDPVGGFSPRQEWPWTWHVLQTNGNYQKIETTRGPEDWAWLKDRLITTTEMLRANLPAWHKNDTSALCSPKWCGSFWDCRGKFMEGDKRPHS